MRTNILRTAYDLTIDTTVKIAAIAACCPAPALMPNRGKTAACVAIATTKPMQTLVTASTMDILRFWIILTFATSPPLMPPPKAKRRAT